MCDKCGNHSEFVDLGICEQVHVEGRVGVERLDKHRFVTSFWTWAKDGNVWVRAVRLQIFRPISSVKEGTLAHQALKEQGRTPPLHS